MPQGVEHEETVGSRIRLYRLKKGWTQVALARQLGITSAALSLIESGENAVTSARLEQIAAILGVRPGTLFPRKRPAIREDPPHGC